MLITWEFPRLCRGGSRSLTYTAVVLRETCDGLKRDVMRGGSKAEHKQLRSRCSTGNTVRWVHSRSLQSDILARCRCHHGDCSAFRSLELGKCHWPLQAALSGSIIKAPGFAGGYLLRSACELRWDRCGRLVSLKSPIPLLDALPLHGEAGGITNLDPVRARTGSIGPIDPL